MSNQERYLSPRVLYFGSEQLFWECAKNQACETFPVSNPRRTLPFKSTALVEVASLDARQRQEVHEVPDGDSDDHEMRSLHDRQLWQWKGIYEKFTSRQITYDSDRIPAFAGIAEEFQTLIGKPYASGIWDMGVDRQFLWRTKDPRTSSRLVPGSAPSWSWLSIKGAIIGPDLNASERAVSTIETMDATPRDPNFPFGETDRGYITSNAFIAPLSGNVNLPLPTSVKDEPIPGSLPDGLYIDAEVPTTDLQQSLIFPLILNVSAYCSPRLTGLLITPLIEDSKITSGRQFRRIGMFQATDQNVCKILNHRHCNGRGCIFENFHASDEESAIPTRATNLREKYDRLRASTERHREETQAIERSLAKSFINDSLERQVITIV